MKYLIVADYHLDENNRLDDTQKSLTKIEEVSQKLKPDYYLNVGDFSPFFRKYFTPLESKILANHFRNIKAKRKIACWGNHDKVSEELTTVDWVSDLRIVNTINITESSGLKIYGAHMTVKEAEVPTGTKLLNHISYKELHKQTKADIILLGHIHKPQVLHRKNPLVLVVGNIERTNFGEVNDEKCFWFLETKKDKSYELTKYKLKTRGMQYIKLDLDNNKIFVNGKVVKVINVKDAYIKIDVIGTKEKISKVNYPKLLERFDGCYKIKTPVNFIYSDTEVAKIENEKVPTIDDIKLLNKYCKLNKISKEVKDFSEKIIKQ